MPYKLFPTAKAHLVQIWTYTEETWGEEQADTYINGLYSLFASLHENRYLWREVSQAKFEDVYACVYKKHFIFFRQLSGDKIGIIGILHQSSDIPNRLKDAITGN